METTRQNKISRLLQKELGLILQLENKNSFFDYLNEDDENYKKIILSYC